MKYSYSLILLAAILIALAYAYWLFFVRTKIRARYCICTPDGGVIWMPPVEGVNLQDVEESVTRYLEKFKEGRGDQCDWLDTDAVLVQLRKHHIIGSHAHSFVDWSTGRALLLDITPLDIKELISTKLCS